LLIMRLIRFGGHGEVTLLQGLDIVSIKMPRVSLDTFRELLEGVGKVIFRK